MALQRNKRKQLAISGKLTKQLKRTSHTNFTILTISFFYVDLPTQPKFLNEVKYEQSQRTQIPQSTKQNSQQLFKQCQARENMHPVPLAGNHEPAAHANKTIAKGGKTCACRQARVNVPPSPRAENMCTSLKAGKHSPVAKSGERCTGPQAREKMQTALSAGKSRFV